MEEEEKDELTSKALKYMARVDIPSSPSSWVGLCDG